MRAGQAAPRTGCRLTYLSARLAFGCTSPSAELLLQPDVVEAHALDRLVEALHRVAGRAEAEEVAVADDRHLLVELPGLLLPERHALLGIGLAGQLRLQLQDALVARPSGPARGEVDVVGRIVEGAHAGREHVIFF